LPDISWYNVPNQHRIYQKAIKITQNGHKINQQFGIPRPSKINPNWEFWYENVPYGNPD
jgi:hypothetical protein